MKYGIVCIWMAAAGAAAEGQMVVSAQLRGWAGVNTPEVVWAQDVAVEIMASAGVRLEWCRTAKRCTNWDERLCVTLVTQSPSSVPAHALADARVFEGHHIRLFMDHIRQGLKGAHRAKAIGHILAHEITHLLQGCSRRSQSGLMKAAFDGGDYRMMWKKTLPFEPEDLELIRLRWAEGHPMARK